MKGYSIKSTIKLTALLLSVCCPAASNARPNTQSYPYWDAAPDLDLAISATSPGNLSRGAGQGQYVYFLENNLPFGYGVWRWSKGNGWERLGRPDGDLTAIAIHDNYLYVGGSFDAVYDNNNNNPVFANYIAKYDITSGQWSALGQGITVGAKGETNSTAIVNSIVVDNRGNVYAGTVQANGGNSSKNMLVKWDGTKWTTVGGGLAPLGGDNPSVVYNRDYIGPGAGNGVYALATDGTNIFAAGSFNGGYSINGKFVESHCIIKWDGTNWSPMAGGLSIAPSGPSNPYHGSGFTGSDMSVVCAGTNVFVAGAFVAASGTNGDRSLAPGIARFSAISGNPLPCDGLYCHVDNKTVNGVGRWLAVQNGTVYVTGSFDTVGSVSANGIAQWHSANNTWSAPGGNGLTLNSTPVAGWYLAADSNAVFVTGGADDTDGNVNFNQAGSVSIPNYPPIARWMTGPDVYTEIDTNFNPNVGGIYDVAVQNNGTILFVGDGNRSVTCLDTNGNPNANFNNNAAAAMATNLLSDIFCIAVDSAHRVYVGGDVQPLGDNNCHGRLIRLNTNGIMDQILGHGQGDFIFDTDPGKISTVSGGGNEIPISTSGGLFSIGGCFNVVSLTNYNVADIAIGTGPTFDAWVDSRFVNYPGMAQNDYGVWIFGILRTQTGTIIGGDVNSSYGDYGIVNANYNGNNNNLTFSGGADGPVLALASQSDGKILVGGLFSTLGNEPSGSHNYLGRFNANGTVDDTFNPSVDGPVNSILVQSDGKILVGEGYDSFGDGGSGLYRFKADGSLDDTFNIKIDGGISKLVKLPDGKILAAGSFSVKDKLGQTHYNIIRLVNHP